MLAFFCNPLIFIPLLIAASVSQPQVIGELVSATQGAEPGGRTAMALKLTHDPGWLLLGLAGHR